MDYHRTKQGKDILISDLTLDHLKNIISLIERRAKKGVIKKMGGGHDADEMWYDETILYGEEALKELNYYDYKKGLDKRNGGPIK